MATGADVVQSIGATKSVNNLVALVDDQRTCHWLRVSTTGLANSAGTAENNVFYNAGD